jgi:hypothetical protein
MFCLLGNGAVTLPMLRAQVQTLLEKMRHEPAQGL